MGTLTGKIALVAGATRGAGRGIATMLGEQGATVVCTGRSTRANRVAAPETALADRPFDLARRPETIEETAERVTAIGGRGVAVACDHSSPEAVQALVDRVRADFGRLDILVNDIWGGEDLVEWGTPFWQLDLDKGFRMLERGLHTHIITSRLAVPLLLAGGPGGLLVEITDGDSPRYRDNLFYDLVKATVMRLAVGMAAELRPHGITALAVTPGFLRSEAMLDHFGVAEANWRDGVATEPHFIASETPAFVGRAVAALAADPDVAAKAGGTFGSWTLSDVYGFTDVDGRRPHWGRYFAETFPELAGG